MKKTFIFILMLLLFGKFVFAEYRVKKVSGNAWVLQDNRKWAKLKKNSIVKDTDRVKVGKGSKIQLILQNGKKIQIIGENTFKVSDIMLGKNRKKNLRLSHFKFKIMSLLKGGSETEVRFIHSTGIRGKDEATRKGVEYLEDEFPDDKRFKKMMKLYVDNDHGAVIEKGNEFIGRYPEYKKMDEVYFMLGNSYFKFAEYEKAKEMLQNVLKISKKKQVLEETYILIGLSCCYLNQEKQAIEFFKEYIDTYPKGKFLAEAIFAIGLSFEELNQLEDAKNFYNNIKKQYKKKKEIIKLIKNREKANGKE